MGGVAVIVEVMSATAWNRFSLATAAAVGSTAMPAEPLVRHPQPPPFPPPHQGSQLLVLHQGGRDAVGVGAGSLVSLDVTMGGGGAPPPAVG